MKLFHPLFLLSLHSSRTSANCYFPNGTDVNLFFAGDRYVPCNAGDDVSMCCHVQDKCRSDGLCLSTWDSNIWRESCTDRTWKSPQCIKLCTKGIGFYSQGIDPKDLSSVDSTITQCQDRSYCCGNGTIGQPCCDQRKGVFLLNGDITISSTETASLATNSFSTASSSSSPPSRLLATNSFSTTSSSSSPPSRLLATSSSPPSQNKAGIIAGTILGVALIITIGFTIFLLKKSRRKPLQVVAKDQASASQMACHAGDLRGGVELNGRGHMVELDGRGYEVELDGRGYEVELVG